ncbi:hypothetical protein CENSYa_1213 [Cenarchaeum symbiosum A]|uniref:CAAX prenyl protease 2/Lysostaphin resistance protein A-like domain-containing protein n=1 Tax=Cenarchaeum symbiosum (strain A) TaxID=414004 RepID=A0RWX0_CENSY|nr:hypothetical protein CENSYa_1213 [Cenarchaeum symbiosum A]
MGPRGDRTVQVLGIPFAVLILAIFLMMAASVPLGIIAVLGEGQGRGIDVPEIGFFVGGIGVALPADIGLEAALIAFWAANALFFAAAILGPGRLFFRELRGTGGGEPSSSYVIAAAKWFSVIVLASLIIGAVQDAVGIPTEPPPAENELVRFFEVTKASIVEELGFRVILVGVPMYLLFSDRHSARHLLQSLWRPGENLRADKRKALLVISAAALVFGIAHITSGEPWSAGKFAQATAAGVIIGWAYFRHGLVAAVVIHWATNYFLLSYAHILAGAGEIVDAFLHPVLQSFEIIFVVAGAVSVAIMLARR